MTYDILKCEEGDGLFPKAFSNLKGMPKLIYYKGDISILNSNKAIAIVGSRGCSEAALAFSRDAGRQAAESGLVVVNGLALGCDTAAILGALDAKGKCAVIMPGGLNKIYPKSNESLAERILDMGGCLISEYEADVEPKKYTYVQRDRLQSAASQGVLVVEASLESGTMHTIEAAMKQHRKLAAYVSGIVSGGANKYVVEKGNRAVSDISELRDYYISLEKEMEYEQLSLF